ncbi:MAG: RiPP maturation radical SAM C-methyltransferase [Myxococcales bacterium]
MAAPTIALVSMPFNVTVMPPIGLGTLSAILREAGLPCTTYHQNLELLPWLGVPLNEASEIFDEISYLWDFLPGEWLFSPQVSAEQDAAYLRSLDEDAGVRPQLIEVLAQLRRIAPHFIARCASQIADAGHDIVGFTSSFMQTQPSLAVARHLKQLRPEVTILFGGSNAFGTMGRAVLEYCDAIDVVAHGEADRLIVPLVHALREGTSLRQLQGISYRDVSGIVDQSVDSTRVAMDDLPVPDFDDYFCTLDRLRRDHRQPLDLPRFVPIETARGCWWGERSHCTFCGLNADRMRFRSKSPERALHDFRDLYRRYGVGNFFAVDNIIDHKYFDTVLASLAEQRERFFIHYEIKANLSRKQVESLYAAGVHKIQPGIESLSTPVLKLMRKGITALQNIQTLRWLTEHGLRTSWYMLYGFPGENLAAYKEVANLLPRLTHIVPPNELAPVYIERFSPYQMRPDQYGIRLTGPARWYRHAFPGIGDDQLAELAYRFEYEEPGRDPALTRFIEHELRPLLTAWQRRYAAEGPTLGVIHGPEESLLVLGRLTNPIRVLRLDAPVAAVLRAADQIVSATTLDKLGDGPVGAVNGPMLDEADYHVAVRRLAGRGLSLETSTPTPLDLRGAALVAKLETLGLVLQEGNRVLSLPINLSRVVERQNAAAVPLVSSAAY